MRLYSPAGLCTTGLFLACLMVGGGCSTAPFVATHPAETTQWRLYRPGMESAAPRRRVRTAARRSPPVVARGVNGEAETTGTVTQSRAHRPWPRVGTPEWNEIQADDAARERRIQNAIGNICRGC
jgi:hypothetical protein